MGVMRDSLGHRFCVQCRYVSSTHKVAGIAAASCPCMYSIGCSARTAPATASSRREVECSYVVLCYVHCYRCSAGQKRINVSAVPTAFVFLWPLSSCLASPGSREQCRRCEQQDNWCCEQDEEQ